MGCKNHSSHLSLLETLATFVSTPSLDTSGTITTTSKYSLAFRGTCEGQTSEPKLSPSAERKKKTIAKLCSHSHRCSVSVRLSSQGRRACSESLRGIAFRCQVFRQNVPHSRASHVVAQRSLFFFSSSGPASSSSHIPLQSSKRQKQSTIGVGTLPRTYDCQKRQLPLFRFASCLPREALLVSPLPASADFSHSCPHTALHSGLLLVRAEQFVFRLSNVASYFCVMLLV